MQKRILSLAVIAIVLFSLFNWNCTKFDTTDIGSDLLPAVDNVHTFADTLLINTSPQGIFNDTTKVYKTSDFVLGAINNDNLFGKTNASIYFQFKPTFYPFYWGDQHDTTSGYAGVGLDSIVLCLSYKGVWGDSTIPLQLEVRDVADDMFRDSIYTVHDINYQPTTGAVLVSATVDVRRLGDTVKYSNGRDYSINHIRIKMPTQWAKDLFNRDSTANPANNAFYIDSVFRNFYKGLAVVPVGGGNNSLVYLNLADTSSKLEVHFKRRNHGVIDTLFQSLILNTSIIPGGTSEPGPSSVANRISRDYSGSAMAAALPGELYLQTTPGTYVNFSIPGLSTLENRIIHRAEIIVQQIPDNPVLDEILRGPNFLYIDLRDTTTAEQWKPIYYDLSTSEVYNPDSRTGLNFLPSSIDYLYFGGYRKSGNANKYYNFNITRYVQQLITKHTPNYSMRLYAPYEIYYPQCGSATYPADPFPYGNNIAAGRIKIGGGNNPNYKMILRIVYSKL